MHTIKNNANGIDNNILLPFLYGIVYAIEKSNNVPETTPKKYS